MAHYKTTLRCWPWADIQEQKLSATNASSYCCCFLLVSSPPLSSSRHSRLLVSISSTNWIPEKNQSKRFCSHRLKVQHISKKKTTLTIAVSSQRQSCRWLHLNAEDCICLSREHPQNWNLDKRKEKNNNFLQLKGFKTCYRYKKRRDSNRDMASLPLWRRSEVFLSDRPSDCVWFINPEDGSQLFTRPAGLPLCCLSLWVRLSLLLLGCFWTVTRTALSWTPCADTRQWPTPRTPSAARLDLRRLGTLSELSSPRFLFSFKWFCGELRFRESSAFAKEREALTGHC